MLFGRFDIEQGDMTSSEKKRERIALNQARLLEVLDACIAAEDLDLIRSRIAAVRDCMAEYRAADEQASISLRRDVFEAELTQILETRTLQRTKYYLRRLRKGVTEVRTSKVNDINLNRWKEYDDILTDSLWMMDRRDNAGAHAAWYWGNFIPQIPHQMMRRYTKRGEWVLDPFAGSGTTLIECRRLGRHGLGVELNPDVAARARELVAEEPNPAQVTTELVQGDSRTFDYAALLARHQIEQVQLALLHPPYHDIIQFSENPDDLSNAASVDDFVAQFEQIVARVTPALARGRYLVVVIGDKYSQGEWIPLGCYLMQAVMAQGYRLKSIVVKNFDETRAKRNQKALWRYRALVGGFYLFKHEYLLICQKS